MSTLAGTTWIVHMDEQGTPVNVNLKFEANGICRYGPYDSTYTEGNSSFTVRVPSDEPPLDVQTQLAGTHADGKGQGVLTHIPSPGFNPDGVRLPFTMHKLS